MDASATDVNQVATIITAVGTACAAIITAILAGSRWLLSVWLKNQLKVQAQKKKNDEEVVASIIAQLRVHTSQIAQLNMNLESHGLKLQENGKHLDSYFKKLDDAIFKYTHGLIGLETVLTSIKAYVEKTEGWKKDIESQIIRMKNGTVMFKGKKP